MSERVREGKGVTRYMVPYMVSTNQDALCMVCTYTMYVHDTWMCMCVHTYMVKGMRFSEPLSEVLACILFSSDSSCRRPEGVHLLLVL